MNLLEIPGLAGKIPGVPDKAIIISENSKYQLLVIGGNNAIRCKTCGMTSYSEGDINHKYCGKCKIFHIEDESLKVGNIL